MIQCQQEDGIQIIELNRPEKKNAFTGTMYDQLRLALLKADADPGVGVIVLTGAGKVFSAGNDVDDFVSAPPEDSEAPPFRFLKALAQIKKPVIAAVNGPAVGIGSTLLFHCDLVFAQDSARFSLPFVTLGLIPEGAASLLLPQRVGHQRACEILFFGDSMSAQEAQLAGIVNRIVDDQPVRDFARSQAFRLAQLPAGSVRQTKALLKPTDTILERIDREAAILVDRVRGPAAQEAFAAFLGKRKPDFSGLS